MNLALYCLVRKMPFVQFQFTPNLLSPVFMSAPPSPLRSIPALHRSASWLPMMLMLMSPTASQHPCHGRTAIFPHLRPSGWFTNRPSSGTAGASRTHPRCLPVRSSPSSLLPPTVLSPTSRSWLTHRRRVLTLHHTLRRCRGAEGWATPLLCPFSTLYRRILHVWMRRGKGCCRLAEGSEGG